MQSLNKKHLIWIIPAILVCVYLIVQLVGVISLFLMGNANRKANEIKYMLLAEESVWVDEQNQYKIVFSPENEGGILYDMESDSPLLCFYFDHPGLIGYYEPETSGNGSVYAKDVYAGSCLFSYDAQTGALILHQFTMQDDYIGTLGKDLVFYRQ